MEEFEIYIILISLVISVLGIYWSKRQFQLFCIKAKKIGLFYSESIAVIEKKLINYNFMKIGHSQRNFKLFRTIDESPDIHIFHHTFDEGYKHDDAHRTIEQHFIYVRCDTVSLTKIQMVPKHLIHKTGSLYRSREITFYNDNLFGKTFHLSGVNEKLIEKIFTKKLRKLMLKYSDLAFETHNDGFLIFRRRVLIKPSQIEQYISFVQCIFEELKLNTELNS